MTTFCQIEDIFQVHLTSDQARVIAKKLPFGFSVSLSRQSKRDVKKVQQDISSEDDNKVVKKPYVAPYRVENSADIKKCLALLQRLKKHQLAAPFLRKLDNVNYPQELEYVDLQTVELNLKNNVYQTATQFWVDIKKIWQMSYTMNNKGSQLYAMTQELEQHFNELYKELDKPYPQKQIVDQPVKTDKQQKKPPAVHQTPALNKKPVKQPSPMEQPMNMQEKRALVSNINSLPPEHLRGVWEIVSDGLKIQDQSEELEFDIDTLPVKKTRQLEKYVNTKLEHLRKQQNKKVAEETKEQDKTDRIVHTANTAYNYASQPAIQQNQLDTGDSSFSSDAESSG
ncbi:unnamed protein product (macronuclear) [Paramecium tetraurelia]|uniref:NET domain-containing protein n=1 Tax=Paramecium tetraurelia TaxID=5888 RepID=A0EDV6_PARTE|nr:uncharacterized protein GSPATT00025817001 [Paramecium tetraurelia]CAK93473.1 unnamed protein product [Paramecium tetraurelia]|eukprot:XP_001460870.1 hypothetical protein (macronuclear) [Paramecium tetraurelia strain d4-2]